MLSLKNHKIRWENGYADVGDYGTVKSIEIEISPDINESELEEVVMLLFHCMGFHPSQWPKISTEE